MSVPQHLMAVSIKPKDYIWERIAETPAPTQTPTIQPAPSVPEPAPPVTPSLPKMVISPVPISYEELRANIMEYHDKLLRVPNWQALLEAENRVRKEARKLARRERKKAA